VNLRANEAKSLFAAGIDQNQIVLHQIADFNHSLPPALIKTKLFCSK
jgi:hypothetical protein